jgi:hypothetical protein
VTALVTTRPRAARWHWITLGSTVLSTALLVALAPRHSPMAVTFVVASTITCGAFAVLERRSPRVGARPVAIAIALLLAVAVITGPRSSNDLWSYVMYGRIVSQHDANPYDKVPADFRNDPFFARVSPVWEHRASLFGPVWVAYESGSTVVAGDSALANRLAFQFAAAAAAAAALVLVWRRTRSAAALAWLGLQPVLVVAVNGGHNDIVIGLAILASAILVARDRPWLAGLVLGLATLIKVTALLGSVGIVLWAVRNHRPRVAWTASLVTVATVAVGYLPIAVGASSVLAHSDRTVTPGSPWNGLADALVGHDAGRLLTHPLAGNATLDDIFVVSAICITLLALVIGWCVAARGRPETVMGATTATYPVVAEYSQPWYATWALPALSGHEPSPIAWIAWLQASVMLAALKFPVQPSGSIADTVTRGLLTDVAPVVLLVAFVIAGVRSARGSASHSPLTSGSVP